MFFLVKPVICILLHLLNFFEDFFRIFLPLQHHFTLIIIPLFFEILCIVIIISPVSIRLVMRPIGLQSPVVSPSIFSFVLWQVKFNDFSLQLLKVLIHIFIIVLNELFQIYLSVDSLLHFFLFSFFLSVPFFFFSLLFQELCLSFLLFS